MKALLLGVLFLPALVIAQQMQGPVKVEKTVICVPIEQALETLVNEFGERPLWGSTLEDSKIVLTINEETRSWSILQFNNKVGCLIEAGKNYQLDIKSK